MITQNIVVDACTTQGIVIGRRGSYGTEEVVFDLSWLIENYGEGSAVLMVKRPTDTSAYQAVTVQAGTTLTWTVSNIDTSYKGSGEAELFWYVTDGLAKSTIYQLAVIRDIGETSETPPDPYQTWVDTLTELGAETLQNAQDAAQSATDAETAKDAAEDAEDGAEANALKAEGFAVGTQNGTPVSSDSPYYEYNAEYMRDAAGQYAFQADGFAGQSAAWATGNYQGDPSSQTPGIPQYQNNAYYYSQQAKASADLLEDCNATATTLAAGSQATASYSEGTFSFGIPKGDKGDQGVQGNTGATPDLTIGTVSTLPAGSSATATITGTAEYPVLSFGIPQGEKGETGDVSQAQLDAAVSTLNTALSNLSAEKAPVIINSASGDIASFSDGADDMPIKSLVATIEPVQDLSNGDPSPTNICPISGWTGLSGTLANNNLGDFVMGKSVDSDGEIADSTGRCATVTPIKIKSGYSYTVSGVGTTPRFIYAVWNGTTLVRRISNVYSGAVLDTSDGTDLYVAMYDADSGSTITSLTENQPMVSISTSSYEEFDGQHISVNWQTEAGTVHGGTATYNGDGTWTVVKGWEKEALDIDGTWYSSGSGDSRYFGLNRAALDVSSYANIISNAFKTTPIDSTTTDVGIGTVETSGGSKRIAIRAGNATNVTELRTYLHNVETQIGTTIDVCYKLATPEVLGTVTTAELLTTIFGTNNVWVDCGSIASVQYPCDTKLYIDQAIATAIAAL